VISNRVLVIKFILSIGFIFFFNSAFSQIILKGIVKNQDGEPIFAANVYPKANSSKNVTTDFEGNFKLVVDRATDTLTVSSMGYQTSQIFLTNESANEPVIVTLKRATNSLAEVIIIAKSPISKRFSAVAISKMDVYLNPSSDGDPLKELSFLPSSTTTDESANPSFRGGSIDRTRVVLNGVPVYQPVRNTQINKIGNFSIFNAEMLDKEYAYASNPPLTYGNSSGGLVEISTIGELSNNQIQFSLTLSSFDVFLSQKINKNSFAQIFSNYQFSAPFIKINSPNLPTLNSFGTKDVGINFNTKFSERVEFNSFNYLIDENYNANLESFTYTGTSISSKLRGFTINNLKYYVNKGVFSINTLFDRAEKKYAFGNISYDKQLLQTHTSLNYKHFASNKLTLQAGVSSDYQTNTFDNTGPLFRYALSPSSPSEKSYDDINNHNLEGYLYANWDIGTKWIMFTGLRSNIPLNKQAYYISNQLGVKYEIGTDHSLSLSGGQYNSYTLPDFYHPVFELLKSDQAALEYSYGYKNTQIKLATFFISDRGADLGEQEQSTDEIIDVNRKNTFGVELSFEQYLQKYLKFAIANTYLNQHLRFNNKSYRGDNDFDFFIKASLNYTNPKLFTSSITYMGRPGSFYSPITGAMFDAATGFYNPTFSNEKNSKRYSNYNRVDVSISRYFRFNNVSFTCFVSLNNILNTKNESNVFYNKDYTQPASDYYQLRTLFFGMVWSLNY